MQPQMAVNQEEEYDEKPQIDDFDHVSQALIREQQVFDIDINDGEDILWRYGRYQEGPANSCEDETSALEEHIQDVVSIVLLNDGGSFKVVVLEGLSSLFSIKHCEQCQEHSQ